MPIYEYVCGKCGALFEELVFSAADEAGIVCPVCKSGQNERRLSACSAVVSKSGADRGLAGLGGSGGCGAGAAAGGGGFR
jgi:putative FmdB family regulatory protein